MSRKLKTKIGILSAFVVLAVIVMGFILVNMQDSLSLESVTEDINQELGQLQELLTSADEENVEETETFDAVYQSKADTLAFMANNEVGFEASNGKMTEYAELLGVDNVLVVSKDGEIQAQAASTPADFSYARYNALRQCFTSGAEPQAVEVDFADSDQTLRYWASAIDNETMVVIEQNPQELYALLDQTTSLESVLSGIGMSQSGYMIAISAKSFVIDYHPDEAMVGADAIDNGIDVAMLSDGAMGWVSLAGEELYCGTVLIDGEYYLGVIPHSDLVQSRNITVSVILFIFFVALLVVMVYGIFVTQEDEQRGFNPENYKAIGPLYFNKAIASKAVVLSFMGFLLVLLAAYYMQTLFALSAESVSTSSRVADAQAKVSSAAEQEVTLKAQYEERYLNKAQTAAYILNANKELEDKAKLQELADTLQIMYVYVFDGEGKLLATNSNYTNFELSDDPESQSYAFRSLLQGVEYLVQEAQPDDISGDLWQYIGVTLLDENGNADGFVQLGIRPSRLENLIDSVSIDHVLDGVTVGSSGFAFAVNKEDGTFAYYPDELLEGALATEHGIAENQLKNNFNDYITIDNIKYYGASAETADYYIYAVEAADSLMSERVPITIATGLSGLICQLILFLLICFEVKSTFLAREGSAQTDRSSNDRMFDIVTSSGRTAKTESARSRWNSAAIPWEEKTPEQKLLTIIKVCVVIFAAAVCIAVLFKRQFFAEGSVFDYILDGGWEHGINIFAITACVMIACMVMVCTMIASEILRLLAGVFGTRGETVCRLLSSSIKYLCAIGLFYYCLAIIGIDTTTLLASAGILSIAVSFGAKELVEDILCGLFIIFEGEFRVGDIIQVGSKRGKVIEIGVRTTKIDDFVGNVIIIRNSDVSDVTNQTKMQSFAGCEVGIEYGEDIERVEAVLARELPKIADRLPAITGGPYYKGVTALGDNSVNIKITAQCAEANRAQLERDLNREMKIIFDQNDVSIPFPQVVINYPKEYQEATLFDRWSAGRFNEQQKEALKDLPPEAGGGK